HAFSALSSGGPSHTAASEISGTLACVHGQSGYRGSAASDGPFAANPIASTIAGKPSGHLILHSRRCFHCCETVTPQGSSPTWIDLITLRDATSMIETSFDTPLVVIRYFSSGVKAMCQTRCPTSRYFVTWCVTPSTTAMRLA